VGDFAVPPPPFPSDPTTPLGLGGEYITSLPKGWERTPKLIATWINFVVPCVKGGHLPSELGKKISQVLRRSGVSEKDIKDAFQQSGQNFDLASDGRMRPVLNPSPPFTYNPDIGPTPSEGPADNDFNSLVRQSALLDAHYQAASNAGNTHQMEQLAEALVHMLRLVGDWKRTTDKDKEKISDYQKQILLNSRNIARVIRPVGPRDPMPGPGGTRVRQVGPNVYEFEIDENALTGEQAEARGGGEGEGEAEAP
jgi:hypothetical protein